MYETSMSSLSFSLDDPIKEGRSLSFSIDVVMKTAALTDPSLWFEGQIWGQGFWGQSDHILGQDPFGNVSYESYGGSTSPVPEPATMFLFGIGLLGLAGVSRKGMKAGLRIEK